MVEQGVRFDEPQPFGTSIVPTQQFAAAAVVDFEEFYLARQPPTGQPGDLLVLSADGKGIVMSPDALREATAKAATKANHKMDSAHRLFCYAGAEARNADLNDEILRFVEFWKARTGTPPDELYFDSKLTSYANLDRLNRLGIRFITLRRRGPKLLAEIYAAPAAACRRIGLRSLSRAWRTPAILDQKVTLAHHTGPIRQIAIKDLGHERPTLALTNQLRRGAPGLIEDYARRMLIENSISGGVDFFHTGALSSTVPMKVNCDLQLTLMGSSLYRLLGERI
ncbi:MAG: hypothetical protein ACYDB7_14400, partial [Mycobacteriales bacterium]